MILGAIWGYVKHVDCSKHHFLLPSSFTTVPQESGLVTNDIFCSQKWNIPRWVETSPKAQCTAPGVPVSEPVCGPWLPWGATHAEVHPAPAGQDWGSHQTGLCSTWTPGGHNSCCRVSPWPAWPGPWTPSLGPPTSPCPPPTSPIWKTTSLVWWCWHWTFSYTLERFS